MTQVFRPAHKPQELLLGFFHSKDGRNTVRSADEILKAF
ncbi:hypothetical protein B4073_4180 [Bacillus subtilis]|uniref:Uncharacterized protein n=2 Tax=Bacillus subtilis TaxID=1423 RepID=A0A0C3LF53_BACIU|nr:hypothetical protein B4067_4563 [Bacillus subtilis subsp. subtilis]KIN35394.1 hypothetical protein B4071_4199 [Bacillus subtilis]GAK81606.1 hypothetical protein BSMD_035220 [Bacillus subtilis Miyagi-4]KIN40211.1 hypothetical protein B4070_4225 [Bacillus subtilis]KIN55741.1 hypothetical protein B4073_4180 [Bacillus subtilis]